MNAHVKASSPENQALIRVCGSHGADRRSPLSGPPARVGRSQGRDAGEVRAQWRIRVVGIRMVGFAKSATIMPTPRKGGQFAALSQAKAAVADLGERHSLNFRLTLSRFS